MTNDDVIYCSRLRLFALANEMGSVRDARVFRLDARNLDRRVEPAVNAL